MDELLAGYFARKDVQAVALLLGVAIAYRIFLNKRADRMIAPASRRWF